MAQLKPGDLFARRLRVIRQLGEGGMADVYLVEHTSLGRQYALKILKWNMQKEALRERLKIEAVAMGRAQHRNIVAVHDLDEQDGQIYITMDYVSGGSLRDLQRKEGQIPSREATRIVMEVLRGLECAHQKGIVHRDVKPDNILLDAEGVPKICDFGIARASGESRGFTQTGAIMGTFWFMAPEQHKVTVRPDFRADLYATGVMLHALIAGIVEPSAPFFYASLEEDPELMDPIPEVLRPIIRKATEHQAHKRYGSAREMAAAIETVWSELPTVAEEREERRVPLMTMVPMGEDEPRRTYFGLSQASSAQASDSGVVSVETSRRSIVPGIAPIAAPAPPVMPGGTLAGEVPHDESPTDPKRRLTRPARRTIGIAGVATLVLFIVVYGFWSRESASPVQALSPAPPEAVTSSEQSRVGGVEVSEVKEEGTDGTKVTKVTEDKVEVPLKPEAKTGPKKEAKEKKVEPRVETVAAPPVPVEAPKTRVTVSGDAQLVQLVGDAGTFTLPSSVPPGMYRVVATFEGEPEPVTPIKRLEVTDKPVSIVCDSSFVRCNRE